VYRCPSVWQRNINDNKGIIFKFLTGNKTYTIGSKYDNNKMFLIVIRFGVVDWIYLASHVDTVKKIENFSRNVEDKLQF